MFTGGERREMPTIIAIDFEVRVWEGGEGGEGGFRSTRVPGVRGNEATGLCVVCLYVYAEELERGKEVSELV